MVTVSSAAPTAATAPTVYPLIQCGSGAGDYVTLGCLATGFTPADLTFKWTDASGTDLSLQPTSGFVQYPAVQKGDKYMKVSQIRVNKNAWETKNVFKCAATHSAGAGEATLEKPVVHLQSPTLEVLIPSTEDVVDKVSLSCFATGFSPKDYKIIWQRNGEKLVSEYGDIIKEEKTVNGTLYSAVSYLQVNQTDWTDEKHAVTCVFEGGDGDVNKSVTYKRGGGVGICEEDMMKMKILPLSIEALFHNKPAQLVCEVLELVQGVESVTWEDMDGNPLPNTRELPKERNKITVAVDVMYEEWNKGIEYNCIATHKHAFAPKEMHFERSNDGRIERPLVFLLPPVEQTSMVTLTCYVKDFYPKDIVVSWLINDEPVETLDTKEYVYHTTNLMENRVGARQVYSVYGQLTFSNATWGNLDTVYSCVVYHESMMNTTRMIVRSMVQRTADKPNLVNLSMNIPESCKA